MSEKKNNGADNESIDTQSNDIILSNTQDNIQPQADEGTVDDAVGEVPLGDEDTNEPAVTDAPADEGTVGDAVNAIQTDDADEPAAADSQDVTEEAKTQPSAGDETELPDSGSQNANNNDGENAIEPGEPDAYTIDASGVMLPDNVSVGITESKGAEPVNADANTADASVVESPQKKAAKPPRGRKKSEQADLDADETAQQEQADAALVADETIEAEPPQKKTKRPWSRKKSQPAAGYLDTDDETTQQEQAEAAIETADTIEVAPPQKKSIWPWSRKKSEQAAGYLDADDEHIDGEQTDATDILAVTDEPDMVADSIADETAPKKGFVWPWKKKSDDGTKKPRKPWSNKKKVMVSVVAAVLAVIIGFGSYAYSIWANPMGQFEKLSQQVTPKPAATQAPDGSQGPEEPTPTIDPYDALAANADFGLLDNIVNIMLIGVDHAEERDDWGGKGAFHSDVMLVLSVNTDTNEVSMISLPRDTYAKIPGVDGIYKLNASIDCGGGWPKPEGFQKVCEAASWMLGDIPVQYYYAVDMNAVKGLVEAIGGVDFDLDIDFKMMGRYYKAGLQHMNGQAVLDYLRVRKPKDILSAGGTGDLSRVDRQKRMLVAIFEKLKDTNLLATIPDLLSAFDGNLHTNTTIAQTAGLAAYAYKNISPEDISMYSMGGHYQDIFGWNFVITDQKARVELIKKVYGVDVPQYKNYTSAAANRLWENMEAKDIQKKAKPVLNQVKAILDADAALPPYPTPTPVPTPTPETPTAAPPTPSPSDSPSPSPSDSPSPSPSSEPSDSPSPSPSSEPSDSPSTSPAASPSASEEPTATPTGTVMSMLAMKPINRGNQVATFDEVPNPANYRKYGDDIWALYNKTVDEVNRLTSIKSTDQLKAANDQARIDIQTLCAMFSIKVPNWDVDYEKAVNEVYVDFR